MERRGRGLSACLVLGRGRSAEERWRQERWKQVIPQGKSRGTGLTADIQDSGVVNLVVSIKVQVVMVF